MLKNLGKKFGTDKFNHEYLDIYEKFVSRYKNEKMNVLEIGVLNGASLKLWKEYFKYSTIYGLDIDPRCIKFNEERIKIYIGSQDDEDVLSKIIDDANTLKIIIDDGSHVNSMTLKTFDILFNHLDKGGLYIIEDLETSYLKLDTNYDVRNIWPGMKYNSKNSNLDNDRKIMDDFFIEKISNIDKKKDLFSIHFYHNVCIMEKL